MELIKNIPALAALMAAVFALKHAGLRATHLARTHN